MTTVLLAVALVFLLCVLAEKFSDKFGMPALILFMFIGMLFGSDGIFKIHFENYELTEQICAIALVFIMFYGGFNTKWKAAKSVAVPAITLSTVGVFMTAGITAALCYWFLKLSLEESFLIGAVLSSTDAASVFAILRKKKLNLKDGTASLLEIESGSNDPVAYMLTIIAINIMNQADTGNVLIMILLQIILGLAVGVLTEKISSFIMIKTRLISEGLDTIFVIAMVLICYGVSDVFGGNAYLSVYLFGIFIGNSRIKHKDTLVPFFDGVTSLAQILIFFLIGLLTFPHQMPEIIGLAFGIVIILTLVARPVVVFLLLRPMKCGIRQCGLIAWAGLRGASSTVFAIMAVASGITMHENLFHIVFMVSLFSVTIQGTLLPMAAEKLKMIDENSDVRKTFNDYQDETSLQLMQMKIPVGHEWDHKKIKDVHMPTGALALSIKRGQETIITRGDTEILAGDRIIFSVPPYNTNETEELEERFISKRDPWCNKYIEELKLPENALIAMIIREDEHIIPDGKTFIKRNDILVMYRESPE